MNAPQQGLIGQSIKRKEDARFLTGRGQYTDDIVLPGQTWAVFVRSPHAHAKIRSIDAAAARQAPGVLAVLTGEDVAADGLGGLPCGWLIHSKDGSPMVEPPHPALAQGKVRHAGDPVVMVVAETKAQARDAGLTVRTGITRLEESTRGFTHGPGGRGLVKVVEDADRGVLVGATVVGPAGGEILSYFLVAVHAAVPVETLRSMIYTYPTFHRAIESALADLS